MAEFKFACPQCGQRIQCTTSYSGRQINCPVCQQAIVVPRPTPVKPQTWQKVLVIAATVLVLVGLVGGGWHIFSKIKIHNRIGKLPQGLVALWSGDGNAIDSVSGNKGTLIGKVTYGKGRIGQAFLFDGRTGRVDIGNPMQLKLQDFTIVTWIKRDNASSVSYHRRNGVLNGGDIFSYTMHGYGFYLDSEGHPGLVKVGSGQTDSDAAIKDTDWHHLAVTKSGSMVVFYVDGIAYPAPAFDLKFDFSSSASIGGKSSNYGYEDNFAGFIDEIGIFNRALSASEIQSIYME